MSPANPPAGRSAPALRPYLSTVVAIGSAILAAAALEALRTPQPLACMALGSMALVSAWFRLNFKSVSATVGIDDTFCITAALLFGPGPATLALAGHSLVYSLRRRRPSRQTAFNAAALAASMWLSTETFFWIARVPPLAIGHASITALVAPLLVMALVYFVLNSGLTAIAVGLDTGQRPLDVWRQNFRWLWVGYLGAASTAFCLILLVQQRSFMAAAMVLPLLAIFHLTLRATFGRLEDAKRHLGDMDRLYLSTIETLAMAIDAKDDCTHSHVRRVQAYAVGLAKALGVGDEASLKAIEAAALLHDTGKLAVPEHILNKPGKLTDSEFEKMKQHVDVGADILSLVEFPYPVVPIVRAHHENWDGSGYPRGIRGNDIPIGARILSVVDCFDALTSDRPYRRAMTDAAAIEILMERRGRMYDPAVVDAFVRVYRDIEVAGDEADHRQVLQRIVQSRQPDVPPALELSRETGASAGVLAFVSLARLASGDAGIADVLALSSHLLGDIVPGTTGAWYLPNAALDTLAVADAFGPAAAVLRGATVGFGERLTGWVAAERQPIVNSDAVLDLGARADSAALHYCVSVPLISGDALVAVLTLYGTQPFADDMGRVLQMVAPHLAASIAIASTRAASVESTPSSEKPSTGLRLVATR